MNLDPALLADTAVFLRAFVKKNAARCDFSAKIHQNAYMAGASPRTPLRKLTELPDPLAGFLGVASWQGRGGKGRERREGGKGKG